MPARGQEGPQCPPDQTAGPGDCNSDAGSGSKSRVRCEVQRQERMPIGEKAIDAAPNQWQPRRGTDRTKRKRELDPVGQGRCVRPVGRKAMGVDPMRERTLALLIHELPVGDVIAMDRGPPNGEGGHRNSEHCAASVFYPPRAFENLDPLPGWREPLQRSRTGMPRVYGLCREGNAGAAFNDGERRPR